jgi:hypothetical protein
MAASANSALDAVTGWRLCRRSRVHYRNGQPKAKGLTPLADRHRKLIRFLGAIKARVRRSRARSSHPLGAAVALFRVKRLSKTLPKLL